MNNNNSHHGNSRWENTRFLVTKIDEIFGGKNADIPLEELQVKKIFFFFSIFFFPVVLFSRSSFFPLFSLRGKKKIFFFFTKYFFFSFFQGTSYNWSNHPYCFAWENFLGYFPNNRRKNSWKILRIKIQPHPLVTWFNLWKKIR